MRRLARVVTQTVVIVLVSSVAAPAMADDLDDYLEKAAEADYAGRQVVVTVWQGRSIADVVALEHAGGAMMVEDDEASTVIGDGKVAVEGSAGVVLSSWSASPVEGRYTTGAEAAVTRLGRQAKSVTILEGDMVRARIVFDVATWAPLATEVFDAEGDLFRFAAFTEFDPNPRSVYGAMDDAGYDYDLVPHLNASSLPGTAGGYVLVDVYAGPGDTAHTFYSDGLFSFSVFEVEPGQARERFAEAETLESHGARYLVLVEPADLWVMWERRDAAYVLVGDLPPDHLDAVLADLPAPRQRNLWDRILGFFG